MRDAPVPEARRSGEILAIQHLRGIASAEVALFHIIQKLGGFGFVGPNFRFLQAGVDIFFVISGFIIWYSQARQPGRGAPAFMGDRVSRVVPLYWLITAFVIATLVLAPSIFGSSRFDLEHIVKSLFFVPSMHPVAHAYFPVVIVGWTLNYEMFFYLLFACSIALAGGSRARLFLGAALPLALLAALPVFVPVSGLGEFYTQDILMEFVFGMLLGVAYLSGKVPQSRWWWIVVVAGFAMTGLKSTDHRLLVYGVPALAIVAGMLFAKPPRLRPLLWLGDISYSLYLTHAITIAAIGAVWGRLGFSHSPAGWLIFVPLSAAAVLAVAHLSWRFIERPGSRFAKRILRPRAAH